MGNVKFALDTGPDAASNSWLKYVRSAPSFEEQNLAACHLTGDQVSDMPEMSWLDLWSRYERNRTTLSARDKGAVDTGLIYVNVRVHACVCVYCCGSKTCVLIMAQEWLYCASVAGPVASSVRK